jgi:hypothetical protein
MANGGDGDVVPGAAEVWERPNEPYGNSKQSSKKLRNVEAKHLQFRIKKG